MDEVAVTTYPGWGESHASVFLSVFLSHRLFVFGLGIDETSTSSDNLMGVEVTCKLGFSPLFRGLR